jgi:hypothetical protein
MDELSYKVRLAALWLLAIIAFFAYRTLAASAGASNVSLLSDSDFASYLSVLMLFAFLSLILPSGLNRLTNMIAGTIFLVGQLVMLGDGVIGYPSELFNVMTGATVIATASIAWLAFRWPRAREAAARTHETPVEAASGSGPAAHAA